MSAIQSKRQPFGSGRFGPRRLSLGTSAVGKLIELGLALTAAECSASIPGLCAHCWAPRNPDSSAAQWPSVFCSEDCEQEFVRAALASLTVEDCIRIHGRLETLLEGVHETAL